MVSNQTPNNPGDPDPRSEKAIATWSALLAHWTAFARAAVALPETDDAPRWRRAVVPIITLQAVVHALGELDRLPTDERALAVDRAGVLIREHAGALSRAWGAEALPEKLLELLSDAREAHAAAAALGTHWLVAGDRFVMPALDGLIAGLLDGGFAGDLLGAPPGSILFRGEPALFARPGVVPVPDGLQRSERDAPPLQVYRQTDAETGLAVRDVVAPLLTALPPGRPMLVPLVEAGAAAFDLAAQDADAWRAQQERALGNRGAIEVRWESGRSSDGASE